MKHVVALSGGKDSTAMALRLHELHPDRPFIFFCTPTGDELPELIEHWRSLAVMLGQPITYVSNGTLKGLIEKWNALPNDRQRWCTRVLKIEPCIAFLRRIGKEDGEKPTLYVGLRADEETREGIYGDEVRSVFPLREWGWGLAEVREYIRARGVTIPARTDCARCYGQKLGEWKALLEKHPAIYADAEADEAKTGRTFRSKHRDTWPAALVDLRLAFRDRPLRSESRQLNLIDPETEACRVCTI